MTGVLPTIGGHLYRQGLHHRDLRARGRSWRAPPRGSILLAGLNGIFSFLAGPTFGEIAPFSGRHVAAAG